MYYIIRAISLSFFSFFLLFNTGYGQTWSLTENSNFSIEGTSTEKLFSTTKNWTATAAEVSGTMDTGDLFSKGKLPKKGDEIGNLSLSINVKAMDGGNMIMNRKMHSALKATTHPEIEFSLSKATVKSVDKKNSSFVLQTIGNLNMAGQEREVSLEVSGIIQADGSMKFMGQYPINMKEDFEIEPPTAMRGSLVVGPEVNINFILEAKK